MQVVILAGGLGVRLRPVTLRYPKAMVPVRGRPFLEYQIDLVRRQGFDRILLLVGHLGEQIAQHFGDGSPWGVRMFYSFETSPLGTGGALRQAFDLLDDVFLLLNGDTYLDTDFRAMAARLDDAQAAAVMAVYDNHEIIAANNIQLDPEGRVLRYDKEDARRMTHVDAGAYILTRDVLLVLPSGIPAALEIDLFPGLAESGRLAGWVVDSRYYDIGTFERLEAAQDLIP